MTVSRVINGSNQVKDVTANKVKEAIRKLGYTPDTRAQSLASAKTLSIGLLYGNPSINYASEFLMCVLKQSSRSGYSILLEKCSGNAGAKRAAHKLLAADIAGVILPAPLGDSKELLNIFCSAGIAAVAVGSERENHAALSVRIDNFKASIAMTKHLLSLGHRDIAFIKGHPDQLDSEKRYQGYLAALEEAGLAVFPEHVAQGYYTYKSGVSAAELLLSQKRRPTAIFASNDDMAAGAMMVAHKLGLDVPEELSIAGFDDTPLATTIWPTLTTVRQPAATMARGALELLLKEINKAEHRPDTPQRNQLLKCKVISRDSSGPVPAP